METEVTPREILKKEAYNEIQKFVIHLSNVKDLSGMEVLAVLHEVQATWIAGMTNHS